MTKSKLLEKGPSSYFEVPGTGKDPYRVTINWATGHWCTCRGMISKKTNYGEDTGKSEVASCKHVVLVVRDHYAGNWKQGMSALAAEAAVKAGKTGKAGGKPAPKWDFSGLPSQLPETPFTVPEKNVPLSPRKAAMAAMAQTGRKAAVRAQKGEK